jgi:hypothetical protein
MSRAVGAVLVAWAVLVPPSAAAQSTLIGRVLTEEGDPVAAAAVTLLRGAERGPATGTSATGTFRLVAPAGSWTLRITALGYATYEREIELEPDEVELVNIRLPVEAVAVGRIEVRAQRERARFEEQAGATVTELAVSDVRRLPGLAEADVLRAVEVLPGVVSTSDFSASFNVRGGGSAQNLILLDGVPIYNPFHLGGVFSVFNTDMVSRAELLAGGFPARYGGRVSSVLDVRSDAGDGSFGVDAGVSLLSSRVAVTSGLPDDLTDRLGLGPVRGRVSARRSYLDVVAAPFFDFPYHLTDLQGVVEAWTDNGVWTVTGYTGQDVLDLRETGDFPLQLRLDWGNDVLGTRWTGTLGPASVDARASFSSFDTSVLFPDFEDTEFRSTIRDVRGSLGVRVPLGAATVGIGAEAAHIEYDNLAASGGTVFTRGVDQGWLGASYAELLWESPRWLVELGGRVDVWNARTAPAFVEPAPRLSVKRFLGGGGAAVDLSLGRYTQALHSARDEDAPIGIDVWIAAGERAPVVVSDQVQVGYEQFWGEWQGSVEAYYRTFDGLITRSPADDLNDPADDFLRGTGTSYGLDFLLRRQRGEVNGWVAVSLLRATRSFPDLLSPDSATVSYPPLYDRRIDVDLVLRVPLPWGVEGGIRFNYGSGLPYTRPLAAYPYYDYRIGKGRWAPEYGDQDELEPGERPPLETAVVLGERNAARYPPYHRLDLSLRRPYTRSWGSFTPFLNLINAYDRRDNVLFYIFEYDETPPVRTGISMFPVLPTFGAEVHF